MISADRKPYDTDIKAWTIKNISSFRGAVCLGPRQLPGRRFNDDEYIVVLLESMVPQKEFIEYPLPAIDKALKEAARADWWYEKEKEYESHDD